MAELAWIVLGRFQQRGTKCMGRQAISAGGRSIGVRCETQKWSHASVVSEYTVGTLAYKTWRKLGQKHFRHVRQRTRQEANGIARPATRIAPQQNPRVAATGRIRKPSA